MQIVGYEADANDRVTHATRSFLAERVAA